MGLGLSLYTVYRVARATAPTWVEAVTGRQPNRDDCDRRLAAFGRAVVDRARLTIEVHGRELVPADASFVYMSNHQSHVDVPVLYTVVPARSLRMVAKKELAQVPFWGRAMRAAGFVVIDRADRAAAVASLREAELALHDGISIWIAPEGTRSKTGAIGPLKKGGFHLALDTGTPIVPVAIDGTRQVLPPGAVVMRPGAHVRVTFGAPIPVAGRALESLMDEVRGFFTAHVNGE